MFGARPALTSGPAPCCRKGGSRECPALDQGCGLMPGRCVENGDEATSGARPGARPGAGVPSGRYVDNGDAADGVRSSREDG